MLWPRNRWKRAAYVLVAVLFCVVLLAIANKKYLITEFTLYSDLKRFSLQEDLYESHAGAFSLDDGRRVLIYRWEDDGFAGQNFFTTLVFDETHQITLTKDKWRLDFLNYVLTHDRTLIWDGCNHDGYNLKEDFFVVRTVC